jgi:16S rRNA (cytidine1402-2'-O)-methyltransferase
VPEAKLYLVPVPIGNLGDITRRALDVLQNVSVIACEDTRNAGMLLKHYGLKAPRLISLHKYNEKRRETEILDLLASNTDIAVISDAGTPGISDPALFIISAAIQRGIEIIPLPGATAFVPALIASGLFTGSFQFLGFLPQKASHRIEVIKSIRDSHFVSVIYEAPHRLQKCLADLRSICGNRRVCVSREISKLHEEHVRGTLDELLEDFSITTRGEIVIVIEGAGEVTYSQEADIEGMAAVLLDEGISVQSATSIIVKLTSLPRNKVYKALLHLIESCYPNN